MSKKNQLGNGIWWYCYEENDSAIVLHTKQTGTFGIQSSFCLTQDTAYICNEKSSSGELNLKPRLAFTVFESQIHKRLWSPPNTLVISSGNIK